MNKSFHPIIATSKYGNNGMKLIPFFPVLQSIFPVLQLICPFIKNSAHIFL